MEFPPPPLWRQGPGSMRTGPKNRKPSSETINLINLAVEKKIPGSSTNACRSKKISPGSKKHTSKSPAFFVTLGQKKIRLGPKNMYRSKKRVPRSKKHASLQKTVPKNNALKVATGRLAQRRPRFMSSSVYFVKPKDCTASSKRLPETWRRVKHRKVGQVGNSRSRLPIGC
jgi:hypothetical protein